MQCTCTILSPVACPALKYLSTFSHKWDNFQKTVIEHKMHVSIFSATFFQNISHSKKTRRRHIKNVYWTSCKVPHYSSQILMALEFYRQIFKKYSNIKFHDNPSSGSQVVTCRQTDMMKLTVTFCNFVNVLKKLHGYHVIILQSINILS